jgi:hypothetical protein
MFGAKKSKNSGCGHILKLLFHRQQCKGEAINSAKQSRTFNQIFQNYFKLQCLSISNITEMLSDLPHKQ